MIPSRVDNLLRQAGALRQASETGRAIVRAAAWFVAVFVGAVAIDAVFALPAAGLITLDVLLAAALVSGLSFAGLRFARNLYEPRRLARLLEERGGVRDSSLINAVELAQHGAHGSGELIGAALEQADATATSLRAGVVVDRAALRRAALAFAGACAAGVLLAILLPGVFAAVSPRLAQPHADHPPFTLLKFDVSVTPQPLYAGKPARVLATITGPMAPQQANVVFVDETGVRGASATPMLRDEQGRFVLPIERAQQRREFYIAAEGGRSRRYVLDVLPTPRFESVEAAYAFPGYTQWKPVSGTLEPMATLRAIQGTHVSLKVRSNLPLRGATLELEREGDGTPLRIALPSDPQDARRAAGSFDLSFTGRYRLTLTAADGAEGDEARHGRVVCVPDAPPSVEFVDPGRTIVAPEGWPVRVLVQASDDVAVARVALHYAVNDSSPAGELMSLAPQGPSRAAAGHTFDLAKMNARAGDVIAYHATVFDNLPAELGGPQSADSPVYYVHVISREQYEDLMRTRYRVEQVNDELAAMKERLDGLLAERERAAAQLEALRKQIAEHGGQPTPEQAEQLKRLEQSLRDYAERARQLAEEMQERAEQDPLYDFEEPMLDQLRQMAEQLQEQSRTAGELARAAEQLRQQPGDPAAWQRFTQAAERFRRGDEAAQRQGQAMAQAQQDLERLAIADRMLQQAESIKSVIRQQRDLAQRLSAMRQVQDPSPEQQRVASRIAQEQDELARELSEATSELERLADEGRGSLPKMSASASEIVGRIRQMSVGDDQQGASLAARTGEPGEAHRRADAAATKLESLLSNCQSMGGEASGELDGCLSMSLEQLQQSLQQMAQGRLSPGLPGMGSQRGGTGAGQAGERSAFGVVGPHQPQGENRSDSRRGGGTAGRGGQAADDVGGTGVNETIDVGDVTAQDRGAGGVQSVPARYRDAAEAYFRRLSREAAPPQP